MFCVLRRDLLASSRTYGVGFSFVAIAAQSFFCLVEGPPHYVLRCTILGFQGTFPLYMHDEMNTFKNMS